MPEILAASSLRHIYSLSYVNKAEPIPCCQAKPDPEVKKAKLVGTTLGTKTQLFVPCTWMKIIFSCLSHLGKFLKQSYL